MKYHIVILHGHDFMQQTLENWPDVKALRLELGLTQSEMASYLGVSTRTIQSCEQGWRHLGPALERTLILLIIVSRQRERLQQLHCWDVTGCKQELRDRCMAYQTKQGYICWHLTGNQCACCHLNNWESKKARCIHCNFFKMLIADNENTTA